MTDVPEVVWVAIIGGLATLVASVLTAMVTSKTTRSNLQIKAREFAVAATSAERSAAIEAYDELITHFRGIVTDQQAQIDRLVVELREAREALRSAEEMATATNGELRRAKNELEKFRRLTDVQDGIIEVWSHPEGS